MGEQRNKPDPVEVIATAIASLGEATAATIAAHAGMAYSTVTPKLRALEDAGRAERVKRDSRTLWRLVTNPASTTGREPAQQADSAAVKTTAGNGPTSVRLPEPADAETAAAKTPGIGDDPHDRTAETPATEPEPTAATTPASPDTDTSPDGEDAGDTVTAANAVKLDDDTNTGPAAANPNPAHTESPEPDTPGRRAGRGDADTAPAPPAAGRTRRPPGELARTALAILQAHPGTAYKVGEMAKLIDQADQGKNYPKASPGAVVLALDALCDTGAATKVADKPATYQLA
jgi:hypothetical protein